MKLLSNIILAIEALVAFYVLWLLYIYGKALWMLDKPTLITVGLCMAIYLFLWPDPQDRKLNDLVKNPYQDGRK